MLYNLKRWWATALIVGTIIALQKFPFPFHDKLIYNPINVNVGEVWRLVTCNFVHLNWNHVWLNLAGYAIIVFSFRDELPAFMELWTLIICGLGSTLGIYYLDPVSYTYAGLSGALHGFLLAHLIRTWRNSKIFSTLFILGVIAKLTWEQTPYADTSATAKMIGGFVAVNAHLFGGITGAILGVVLFFFEKNAALANEIKASSKNDVS